VAVRSQCEACGRFAAYPQDFTYDTVCGRCENDPRPGVQRRRGEAEAAYERFLAKKAASRGR
jgi:hypothetical protein